MESIEDFYWQKCFGTDWNAESSISAKKNGWHYEPIKTKEKESRERKTKKNERHSLRYSKSSANIRFLI